MNLRPHAAFLALNAILASFAGAQIRGTITLKGDLPPPRTIDMSGVSECAARHPDPVDDPTLTVSDKGELAYVIVSIKPDEGRHLQRPAPDRPARLDQHGCMYFPHVLAMMAGQTLIVKNDDDILHNVHSMSQANPPFNFVQPTKDDSKAIRDIKAPEIFQVKCDIHPWMTAFTAVFDHPYFAVSDEAGRYSFDAANLPDGQYTLVAWHEKLGTQEQKITVKQGSATADFTFKLSKPD